MSSKFLNEQTYQDTRLSTEEARTIVPEAYYSEEFFNQEKKQIFTRNWTVAGPASNVANPGEIMLATVGGQSIIITRDENKQLRAFHNVCRHRGTQLCQASTTVKKHIVCPYHGWTYSLKGECIGTPLFDRGSNRKTIAMHDMSHLRDFDKKDFGLFPVRVEQWGMLIFVCLSDSAPNLAEVIGDLPQKLANYRLEQWQMLREVTYDINCNWKLLFENAIEYYHLPWVHPRLAKTSKVSDHHRWQGTGMYCGICTSPLTSTDDSSWLAMKNLSGLTEAENNSGYFFGLFPNVIIFIMPSHAFVINANPIAPGKTIETAWLMSHPECISKTTGEEINAVLEFWNEVNLEDVGICQKVQLGIVNEQYQGGRLCYQFEEPVHRYQNMVIDAMIGRRHIPTGDDVKSSD